MSSNGLRIIFAGTPEFAAHHLQALINSHHTIIAVYTQPDRPAGRGKKLSPSAVKQLAMANALKVLQPPSLKDKATQQLLAEHRADVMVVVAYGLLLPEAVLEIPRFGCLNVHGSILPRWRGAAPIQRALAAGDDLTGVTIMQMDVGLDSGDMLLKRECAIDPDETSASLHDKLMQLGAPALLEVLSQLPSGSLRPQKQNHSQANYAEKISKQEALIDWSKAAVFVERSIRAYNPFPIAYSFVNGQRIKIYKSQVENTTQAFDAGEILALDESGLLVGCGQQALRILQLQVPGKKPMSIIDIINGYSDSFPIGAHFAHQ
ncbi:MAG: methionyl-tRNA formyltransferase [Pseudomonadota bacterium]